MSNRSDWDYSLRLRGVNLEGLGLARLAQYMAEFAQLLGDDANPVFAGVVKGSVMLRAKDRSEIPMLTRSRLKRAANDEDEPAHRPFVKITKLLNADGATGEVLDHEKNTVVQFPTRARRAPAVQEFVINDTGELDGVIVAVEGIDETAHLGLQDQATREVVRIQVRDMQLARLAAANFRGDVIRVRVHGTWRRGVDGKWSPQSLYADAIEELEQADARSAFVGLGEVRDVGWAKLSDAEADRLVADLRSAG